MLGVFFCSVRLPTPEYDSRAPRETESGWGWEILMMAWLSAEMNVLSPGKAISSRSRSHDGHGAGAEERESGRSRYAACA